MGFKKLAAVAVTAASAVLALSAVAQASVTVAVSKGLPVTVSAVRENVYWTQSVPSWDKLVITGPGPVNGKTAWVHVTGTTGEAGYTGLGAGHHYQVAVTPYTAPNGTPEGAAGRVSFVTMPLPPKTVRGGEFCAKAYRLVTVAAPAGNYTCLDNDGWRWEPAAY